MTVDTVFQDNDATMEVQMEEEDDSFSVSCYKNTLPMDVNLHEEDTIFDSSLSEVLENGGSGAAGKSAYEIAVENGFVGTEKEWLESLKGKDGKDGRDGVDGKDGETPVLPTKVSAFENDAGYLTEDEIAEDYATKAELASKADLVDGKIPMTQLPDIPIPDIPEFNIPATDIKFDVVTAVLEEDSFNPGVVTISDLSDDPVTIIGKVNNGRNVQLHCRYISHPYDCQIVLHLNNFTDSTAMFSNTITFSSTPFIVYVWLTEINGVTNVSAGKISVALTDEDDNEVQLPDAPDTAEPNVLKVTFDLNPSTFQVENVSHTASEIIAAYNSGKNVQVAGNFNSGGVPVTFIGNLSSMVDAGALKVVNLLGIAMINDNFTIINAQLIEGSTDSEVVTTVKNLATTG